MTPGTCFRTHFLVFQVRDRFFEPQDAENGVLTRSSRHAAVFKDKETQAVQNQASLAYGTRSCGMLDTGGDTETGVAVTNRADG